MPPELAQSFLKAEVEIMPDMPAPDTPMADETPHDTVDITAQLCPMTFVRTRLALDRLQPGQILAVRLQGEEPRRNVPRTAAEQGHQVLGKAENEDGSATLLIRKGG
jgi:tRNA 2-thiouridine synthesizing protein A